MTSPVRRPGAATPTGGNGRPPDADGATDSAVWTLRVWREASAAAGVRARIIAVTMDGPPARQTAVTDSLDDVLVRLRAFLDHVTAGWHNPADRREPTAGL